MSVRCYRLKRFEYEQKASFNLWNDEALKDFIEQESNFFETFNGEGGYGEVEVSVMQRALDEGIIKDEELRQNILRDIRLTKKQGDDWIRYYCF